MIKKLLGTSKNYTQSDLEKALFSSSFNESTLNDILKCKVNINSQNKNAESYLHLCVKKNLILSVQWLIKNGIDINLVNSEKETALFTAMSSNNKQCMQYLLSQGLDANSTNKYSRTPLQEAILLNNDNVIDLLLEKTKNINNLDANNRNIIFDAIFNGNLKIINKLLSTTSIELNHIDSNGNTILHDKMVLDNDALALKLIQAGANPTIEDATQQSYLNYLTKKGIKNIHTLNKILELGYDLSYRDTQNRTLLMNMIVDFNEDGCEETSVSDMIKALVTMGIDVNAQDNEGENVLFFCVKFNDLHHVQYLLQNACININAQNIHGETVLSLAVLKKETSNDLILSLLEYKPDIRIKDKKNQCSIEKLLDKILHSNKNKQDNDFLFKLEMILSHSKQNINFCNSKGEPTFFEVMYFQDLKVLKLFRRFNLDINQKDISGNNAIHNMICRFKQNKSLDKRDLIKIIQLLVVLGIDINARDKEDKTVLHNAIVEDWQDVIRFLLEKKADINAMDVKGRSLIHSCVWKNDVKNFKLLHMFNLTVLNVPDDYGILPINYAAFMGYKELVVAMIEAGSYVNNTNTKNQKIAQGLAQHSDNLDLLLHSKDKKQVQRKISLLIENMKSEFELL